MKRGRIPRAPRRQDRLVEQSRHDTYERREKLPEPSVCTGCGALYASGHWTWRDGDTDDLPADAHRTVCAACQRIRDRMPAGIVELRGDFLGEHREEILNLARNVGKASLEERPLGRIMDLEEREDGSIRITTTDVNTARRIGDSVHQAYEGELELDYAEGDKIIRVDWER